MIKLYASLLTAAAAVLLANPALDAAAQQMQDKATQRPGRPLMQEEPAAPPSAAALEARLRDEVQANPGSANTLYRLATLLQQEDKPRESLDAFTRAARLQQPTADQLRSVALDYVLLGDYEDAVHWLRVALGFDPHNVTVLYSLGRCFYTQNNFAEAEVAFVRVLQLQPHHLKAMENLGLTFDGENKPDRAEKALRTAATWAAEQHSSDPWPDLDLGVFLLDQNRATEALPFLSQAAALGPSLAQAHLTYGRALVLTGQAANGIVELEQAAKLDPRNPKVHYELGHAYRDAGQLDKARAEFAISKSLYGSHNQN